jgi:hypothetical protein
VRSALLAIQLLLLPSAAVAASRIVVVEPAESDQLLSEAVIRLRAELASDGFEVERVARGEQKDVRAELEQAPPGPVPVATLALMRVAGKAAIDVWVVDRVSGKTLVRRVEAIAEGDLVPAALAIRAVDLLQASLAESTLPGRVLPQKMPADLAALLPKPLASKAAPTVGFGLGVGVGVLHSFAGLGPAVTPVVQLTRSVHPHLAVRLELAGPAFSQSIEAVAGLASPRQELATLGLSTMLGRGSLAAQLVCGLGAYHLHAAGNTRPPNTARRSDAWAAAATLGAGAAVQIGSQASLVGSIEAIATFPGVAISIGNSIAARAGRPSVLASLGPVWSF